MKKLLLFIILKYKKYLSPIFEHFGVKCKYYPTCSEYARQAIEKYRCFLWDIFKYKKNTKM